MKLFFERQETPGEVVITFRYQWLWYVLLLTMLLLSVLKMNQFVESLLLALFGLVAVIWIIGRLPANREIRRAMQFGKVEVAGNKYSFKNPLTFRIKK